MAPRPSQDPPRAQLHPYPQFRQAIASWLEHARSRAGLSQAQLARLSGVSAERLGRMALGSADLVAVWELYLLAQELGPCAPPIPFAPAPISPGELMRTARALRPDERDGLVVCCYATIEGATIDVQYSRAHDEWPLAVSDKLCNKLHRRGLVWQLERYDVDLDGEDEDDPADRAICVRTLAGNAIAEVLGREMF